MCKLKTIFLISFSIFISLSIQAKSDPTKIEARVDQVFLYEQPNTTSKMIAKLNPMTHLVPIFQQGGWVKVGNRTDGQVGWVDIAQYRLARINYFQPRSASTNVQTVFIQMDQPKDHNPTLNIVAYKNGEKLNEKETKELYEKIQKQQKDAQQNLRQFNEFVNHHFFADPWFDFSVSPNFIDPIIIMPDLPRDEKQTKKGEETVKEKNIENK